MNKIILSVYQLYFKNENSSTRGLGVFKLGYFPIINISIIAKIIDFVNPPAYFYSKFRQIMNKFQLLKQYN